VHYHEIKDKLRAGDIVYICDYRFNNVDEKPIRHVKPQKAMVFSNDDLPKNKRVYYSKHHFRPLNAKGNPTSKIIAPYDNTGYRSYTGVSLNIFFTEAECLSFYKKQCDEIIDRFNKAKAEKLNYYESKINEIKQEYVNLLKG